VSPLLIGFVTYFLITLVVGVVAMRRNRSMDSYLIADRKLGAWVAAFSERASGESAWLLIGLPGVAYASGLSAWWVGIGCVTGIAFSWFAVARRLREQTAACGALTVTDYLEIRTGDTTRAIRLTATVIILLFFTFYVAAQFLAAGKVLNTYLGLPPLAGMLIGAGLVLFYTMAGGLYAVAWTDLFQGIIMLLTLVVLPLAVLHEVGGPAGLHQKLSAAGAGFVSWAPGTTGWAAVSGVLGSLAIGQPHLVLRFMATADEREIRKGRAIAIVWAILAFGGAILIGLAGLAWFGPDAVARGLLPDQERLMPELALRFMPAWLSVIMICGAIAAMMSTADSQLLSSASAVSEDVYRRLLRPGADQRTLLAISRWATLAVGVVAFVLAWQARALVYTLVLYAWAGLGAAFGPPLLLSLWWRRVSRDGVLAGMIAGTVTVLIWYNVPALKSQLYEMIPGFVLSLAATVLVSLLRPNSTGADTGGKRP